MCLRLILNNLIFLPKLLDFVVYTFKTIPNFESSKQVFDELFYIYVKFNFCFR